MNILDKKIRCNKLIPSERIYWDKFPYKIVMNAPSGTYYGDAEDLYRAVAFMKEMHHATAQLSGEIRRRYVRYTGVYTMYLTSLDDVRAVCNLKHVTSVHGPISQSHMDLLNSNTSLSVGKRPFFGQYTHKYVLWYTYAERQKHGFSNNVYREIKEYLVDQCGADVLRLKGHDFWATALYINKEHFDPVFPFLQITFPGLRIEVTQRYIWDNK